MDSVNLLCAKKLQHVGGRYRDSISRIAPKFYCGKVMDLPAVVWRFLRPGGKDDHFVPAILQTFRSRFHRDDRTVDCWVKRVREHRDLQGITPWSASMP